MFTRLLPRRMAPINRSLRSHRVCTASARLSPWFNRRCIRGRDAAVSAVSEPEKKPERIIKTRMAMVVRMSALSIVDSISGRREGAAGSGNHSGRGFRINLGNSLCQQMLDVAFGHLVDRASVTDGACQNKGQAAVFCLLVTPHMLDQALWFPGPAAETLEPGGKIEGSQMTPHSIRFLSGAQAQLGGKLER